VVLTVEIGGAIIQYGNFSLAGIGLAATMEIILNLVLPRTKVQEA